MNSAEHEDHQIGHHQQGALHGREQRRHEFIDLIDRDDRHARSHAD